MGILSAMLNRASAADRLSSHVGRHCFQSNGLHIFLCIGTVLVARFVGSERASSLWSIISICEQHLNVAKHASTGYLFFDDTSRQ